MLSELVLLITFLLQVEENVNLPAGSIILAVVDESGTLVPLPVDSSALSNKNASLATVDGVNKNDVETQNLDDNDNLLDENETITKEEIDLDLDSEECLVPCDESSEDLIVSAETLRQFPDLFLNSENLQEFIDHQKPDIEVVGIKQLKTEAKNIVDDDIIDIETVVEKAPGKLYLFSF